MENKIFFIKIRFDTDALMVINTCFCHSYLNQDDICPKGSYCRSLECYHDHTSQNPDKTLKFIKEKNEILKINDF